MEGRCTAVSHPERRLTFGETLHTNSHLAVLQGVRMRASLTRYQPRWGNMDFAGQVPV